MEGYIEGVLTEIATAVHNRQCTVDVHHASCGISDPRHTPCRFEYTIKFEG